MFVILMLRQVGRYSGKHRAVVCDPAKCNKNELQLVIVGTSNSLTKLTDWYSMVRHIVYIVIFYTDTLTNYLAFMVTVKNEPHEITHLSVSECA